jgi:hypothetical protein
MLRHTFVTTMLDASVDLRDVQIAARHADPRTAMGFASALPWWQSVGWQTACPGRSRGVFRDRLPHPRIPSGAGRSPLCAFWRLLTTWPGRASFDAV